MDKGKKALSIIKGTEYPEEFNPEYRGAIEDIAEIIKSDPSSDNLLWEYERMRIAKLIVDAGYRKPKEKPMGNPVGFV